MFEVDMDETVVVSVRIRASDYENFKTAAETRQLSVSSYLRSLIYEGSRSGRSVRELVACLETDAHLRRTLRRLILNPAED